MKEQMKQRLEQVLQGFPSEKAADEAMARAADFLAGAQATACAMAKQEQKGA